MRALPRHWTNEELDILRRYRRAYTRILGDYVLSHTSTTVIDEPTNRELTELYVIIRFLEIPDHAWSLRDIEAFPDSLKGHGSLKIIEQLALQIRRPLTALRFIEHRQGKHLDPETCYNYLVHRGRTFAKEGRYRLGTSCFQAGVQMAEENRDVDRSVRAGLELADLYDKMGHPNVAAETIGEQLKRNGEAASWGKAALLRLRYMYKTKGFSDLLDDGTAYLADERCKPYRPQIMYILWVTHRRLGQSGPAKVLEEGFLHEFPKHPLAADMYFAAAMSALASGDYQEAERLLEVIEYRYPKSRIRSKVKSVQAQLRKRR